MSVYNKADLKNKIESHTPVFSHKKNNSMNILNTVKFMQGGSTSNCLYKNKLELKTNTNSNTDNSTNNTYTNINNNRLMTANCNINKLFTSTNLKNRRIEINLDKDSSNSNIINNSARDNIILLNQKHSTSSTSLNKNGNRNKNSYNNINININISKKIISTYYNKSKDNKELVVNKKGTNSMNNSKLKESENKYYKLNNNFKI
jgi:hypothetical protein